MRTVRIFISSPGDVAEERDRARQTVEQLRRRYAGRLELKPILWEDLPLQADMAFQQGIDIVLSEQGMDIAVFILWSRLGSPLGARIRKTDGSEYRSGTEREFDLVMKAREKTGGQKPDILVYTRADDVSFEERLRGRAAEEKEPVLSQKKLVERFILEEFHDPETKANIRAYHTFHRPPAFSSRLRTHLQELLDGIAGDMPAAAVWDVSQLGSPFVGLESFQPRHAPVFFGREDEILEIRQALSKQAAEGSAFLLIAGASGSGKSSLARAGVLPAIVENETDETISHWVPLILTPGEFGAKGAEGLLEAFAAALPALAGSPEERLAAWRASSADFVTSRLLPALARVAHPEGFVPSAGAEPRLFFLVDQLEELFSGTGWSERDRLLFLETLEALALSGKAWVLATVRADFLGAVQNFPPLVRLRAGGGQFDLPIPETGALRRLITEPARLAGLRFEERDGKSLADQVLQDAAGHRELLPLVSHLLADLSANAGDDGVMTFRRYQEVGGVTGALAARADEALASSRVTPEMRAELGAVLNRLVSVSGEDENSFVRQYPSLSDFTPAQLGLVENLIEGRLLVTGKNQTVSLAHEALLRVWEPAREWIEANRDFLRTRARVEARRRQGAPLLEGDPLLESARAQFLARPGDFTELQSEYIRENTEAADAGKRRREKIRARILAGLTGLTLLSLAGGLVALVQWRAATTAKNQAETRRIAAEEARKQADHARGTAEQLINQNLFQLRDKLLPVGRLDLLDEVSNAALNYFQRMPEAQRTESTERQRSVMLNNRGDILAAQGRTQEALTSHREALAITGRLFSAQPRDAERRRDQMVTLNKVGDTLMTQGNTEEALKQYEEALTLAKDQAAHAGSDPAGEAARDLSAAHSRIGDVKFARAEYPAALEAYREAESVLKSEEILNKIGNTHVARQQADDALASFREALALRQTAARKEPENRLLLAGEATLHDKLGDVLMLKGDQAGALAEYQTAGGIRENLVRHDPSNRDWRSARALSHEKLGDAYLTGKRSERALEEYSAARTIVAELAAADPYNVRWQSDLALADAKIGDARMALNDHTGAFTAYQAAHSAQQLLAEVDASNGQWQQNYYLILTKYADAARLVGHPGLAGDAYDEALVAVEKLRLLEPGNPTWKRAVYVVRYKMAGLAAERGDGEASEVNYSMALEVLKELAAANAPLTNEDKAILDQLQKRFPEL